MIESMGVHKTIVKHRVKNIFMCVYEPNIMLMIAISQDTLIMMIVI